MHRLGSRTLPLQIGDDEPLSTQLAFKETLFPGLGMYAFLKSSL